ncbi:transaldolase [Catenulispora acidiphila DSM 44928]|uniref:Transaldolase n=1 Tax=Catenulispora acidiphila (strain DSM 44928 / JCM 14897 / NBRC 102108 / NRRL B-24433 / ID139908) TaxID=479433 RepID=C7PWP8_CATAD|nr:transaldolase family protein [Catenulispora acidiphila]ACU75328.1 transaldolase [Catenulispora acidiphila DSM 44928]
MTATDGRLGQLASRIDGIWADGLARDRIRERGLASLVARRSVTGAVLGAAGLLPALKAGAYREQIAGLAGHEPAEIVLDLLATDAQEACDVVLPAFTAGPGQTGMVAVELDYGTAAETGAETEAGTAADTGADAEADTEADTETAAHHIGQTVRRFTTAVARPNLLVTIPATPAGLTAATAALADGISILIGPVADPAAHGAAVEAYVAGLDKARAAGHDLSKLPGAIGFALSHTDTEVDKRLWAIATDRSASFRGRTAVALARTTFAAHEETLRAERWKPLAAAGARPPLLLWSATRARDPYYSETLYVDTLVAPGVATAMTEATMGIVAESDPITDDTLHGAHLKNAEQTLADLRDVGIDFDDVATALRTAAARRSRIAWHAVRDAAATALHQTAGV